MTVITAMVTITGSIYTTKYQKVASITHALICNMYITGSLVVDQSFDEL